VTDNGPLLYKTKSHAAEPDTALCTQGRRPFLPKHPQLPKNHTRAFHLLA